MSNVVNAFPAELLVAIMILAVGTAMANASVKNQPVAAANSGTVTVVAGS